jgi:hypothetical protein
VAGGGGNFVSGIPRLARAGNRLVFAWTESHGAEPSAPQEVMTATAQIP